MFSAVVFSHLPMMKFQFDDEASSDDIAEDERKNEVYRKKRKSLSKPTRCNALSSIDLMVYRKLCGINMPLLQKIWSSNAAQSYTLNCWCDTQPYTLNYCESDTPSSTGNVA